MISDSVDFSLSIYTKSKIDVTAGQMLTGRDVGHPIKFVWDLQRSGVPCPALGMGLCNKYGGLHVTKEGGM